MLIQDFIDGRPQAISSYVYSLRSRATSLPNYFDNTTGQVVDATTQAPQEIAKHLVQSTFYHRNSHDPVIEGLLQLIALWDSLTDDNGDELKRSQLAAIKARAHALSLAVIQSASASYPLIATKLVFLATFVGRGIDNIVSVAEATFDRSSTSSTVQTTHVPDTDIVVTLALSRSIGDDFAQDLIAKVEEAIDDFAGDHEMKLTVDDINVEVPGANGNTRIIQAA